MNIRYFPFSPGIGWQIKHGKYLVPGINLDVWKKIIVGKDLFVIAYGGLLESYFALSYLEMLNYISPINKIYWCGESKFEDLVNLNGLAKIESSFPKDLLNEYPVPIFLDRDNALYFHCLNNYQVVKPYYGGKGYIDNSPITKQLWRNSNLSWDTQYLPKFRKLKFPNTSFINWSKTVNFNIKTPYICLFQNLNYSQHKISTLNWQDPQIKFLADMLKYQGIATVLFTLSANKFYGSSIYCPAVTLENIIALLSSTKGVLAEEVDFLFLAMMMGIEKIIMKPIKKKLNLKSNNKFLNLHKDNIFVINELTPLTVCNLIQ